MLIKTRKNTRNKFNKTKKVGSLEKGGERC